MTRNRARGEDALFDDPRARRGRVERGVDAYAAQRRAAGNPLDPLTAAMLRDAARDRDLATMAHDLDIGPRTTRALRELVEMVKAEESPSDGFADELAALLAPTDGNGAPT